MQLSLNCAHSTGDEFSAKTIERHPRILIIEDEPAIREAITFALEFEGIEVFVAADGQEAFEVLSRMGQPCLILLDLMMPVMNGWEFAAELKKRHPLDNYPIVLVTAYSERAKDFEALNIVPKPVDLEQLLSVVRNYCS
jgi:CheY-like chemotaxis protein